MAGLRRSAEPRVARTALIALVAGLALAGSAQATFKGQDGLIAFSRVYEPSYRSELWVVRPDGRRARRISWGRSHEYRDSRRNWGYSQPQWSPDGGALAVVKGGVWRRPQVWIARPWTAKPRFFAHGSSPAWSPDGRTIAFTQVHENDPYEPYETTYMYTKRVAGGAKRQLTAWPEVGLFNLAWSPDGARIAFDEDGSAFGADRDIYTLTLADGESEPMVATAEQDANPDWHPEGFPLLLECEWNTHWTELCAYDPSREGEYGNGVDYLWHEEDPYEDGWDFDPVWSPRGGRIVWTRAAEDTASYDLFTMRADTTGRRRITRWRSWEVDPSWQPRRIRRAR